MKKIVLSAFCLICAFSLYAQQTVTGAAYEKLFAAAQKYESEGRWFYAINAWYDCIESDIRGSSEAWNRYSKLKERIEAGDQVVWNALEDDERQYWIEHFSTVYRETGHGIQKSDSEHGVVEYVVQYDIGRTARYEELTAMMQKGSRKAFKGTSSSVYDCVLQLSVVHEDGTLLFVGTPQVAGGRYVFSGFPKQFVQLLVSRKAYVQASVVAVRSAEGNLVRVAGGEQFCLLSRYRPEVAEREYRLTTTLADRQLTAGDVQVPVAQLAAVAPAPQVADLYLMETYSSVELEVDPAVVPANALTAQEETSGIFEEPGTVETVADAAEEPAATADDSEEQETAVSEEPAEDSAGESAQEQSVEEQPAAEETDEKGEEKKEKKVREDSPVVQVMKDREQAMKKKLDETPERTLQMTYVGISHDMRPQLGTYVSAPVVGPVFIGLNAAVGMKGLSFSYDAMVRIGFTQSFGKLLTVGAYGIGGVYGYPVSGVKSGYPPVTVGAGVLGEVVVLKMAAGAYAWTGYSLDGKLATNVSLSVGWKLDK